MVSDSIGMYQIHRDGVLAHRDLTTVLGGAATNEGQLTWADVDTLIESAITIINHYGAFELIGSLLNAIFACHKRVAWRMAASRR
jgi:hypothetical protein